MFARFTRGGDLSEIWYNINFFAPDSKTFEWLMVITYYVMFMRGNQTKIYDINRGCFFQWGTYTQWYRILVKESTLIEQKTAYNPSPYTYLVYEANYGIGKDFWPKP